MPREIITDTNHGGTITKEQAQFAFQTSWNVWEVMGSLSSNFLNLKSVKATFDREDKTREFPNKRFIDFDINYNPVLKELVNGWTTKTRLHLGKSYLFPSETGEEPFKLVLLDDEQNEQPIEIFDIVRDVLGISAGLVEGVRLDLEKKLEKGLGRKYPYGLRPLVHDLSSRLQDLRNGGTINGTYFTLGANKKEMKSFFE